SFRAYKVLLSAYTNSFSANSTHLSANSQNHTPNPTKKPPPTTRGGGYFTQKGSRKSVFNVMRTSFFFGRTSSYASVRKPPIFCFCWARKPASSLKQRLSTFKGRRTNTVSFLPAF